MEHILAHALAHLLNQLQIVGGRHDVLRGKCHTVAPAHHAFGKAGGAVKLLGGGQVNGGKHLGLIGTVVNQVQHIPIGDLANQVIPSGIAIVLVHKVDGVEGTACPGGRSLIHIAPIQLLVLFHKSRPAGLLMGQPIGPHGVRDPQTDGGLWECPAPVIAREIDHLLILRAFVLVQIGIVKQVGDRVAGGGGNSVGRGVQCAVRPLGGEGCIAGAGHTALIRALGHQDVIDGVVCIGAHGEVIVPGVQDIGLGGVGVIAGDVLLGHVDGEMLRRAGLDFLLVKAAQLHGGLFNAVFPVIVRIRGLEINLHRMLAVHAAGVGYIHANLKGIALVLHGKVGVAERGVAQAGAEGEGNIGVVIVVARAALTQHIVLIPCLIVAVAHVDALLVDHVVHVALVDAGGGIVLGKGQIILGCVGIGVGIIVDHGGGGMVIL